MTKLINEHRVECLETLANDYLLIGTPKQEVLDMIHHIGSQCLDLELYELMPKIKETFLNINKL